MASFPEYESYDAVGLAQLVRNGYISSGEVLESAIERIEERNPVLNAVIHKMYDQARLQIDRGLPEGAFRGVPFLLKDLTAALEGEPLRAGSRFMEGFVSTQTSTLVKRYLRAGLVVIGKTNTPEFGITPFTEPAAFGPTGNPWDIARTPGGSSGGSAAAVAAGMVPAAHGGDGGGSIRIPASCCGLFGFKPTRARTPSGPETGYQWHGCVVEHVLTRSVRDSACLLDVTEGPDVGAPYFPPPPKRSFRSEVDRDPATLRIAFTAHPFMGSTVHVDCRKAVEDAVDLLEDLGHDVEETRPPIDGERLAEAFLTMICSEVWTEVLEAAEGSGRSPNQKYFEPGTWLLALIGRTLPAQELSRALRDMHDQARIVGTFFQDYDILLTPTLASPPFETGALQPSALEALAVRVTGRAHAGRLLRLLDVLGTVSGRVFDFTPYTPVFNVTGQPAMSVPLYWNDADLPIGVQLVGRYAEESQLFRLASQLERARPWFHRVPHHRLKQNAAV